MRRLRKKKEESKRLAFSWSTVGERKEVGHGWNKGEQERFRQTSLKEKARSCCGFFLEGRLFLKEREEEITQKRALKHEKTFMSVP